MNWNEKKKGIAMRKRELVSGIPSSPSQMVGGRSTGLKKSKRKSKWQNNNEESLILPSLV